MADTNILSRSNKIKKKAFTLLELIIVIIVIGVLAALAIPNYLKTLNVVALAEALSEISVLQKVVEGCYNIYGSYDKCAKITELPVDDPQTNPAANFRYGIGASPVTFWIVAARNEIQQGNCGEPESGDYIAIRYASDMKRIKCGYGNFKSFSSVDTEHEGFSVDNIVCTNWQGVFKSTVDDEYK